MLLHACFVQQKPDCWCCYDLVVPLTIWSLGAGMKEGRGQGQCQIGASLDPVPYSFFALSDDMVNGMT